MADQIMAESKAKKPGLLRRIVWWLGVMFLTALLVLGFAFSAPWKVITLIAIFLAAATILPRIYRKWFWLAVGLVVLSLIVWIFLPDDNKGWRPYTFDKELAQLQTKYAIPDSENAAIIYNQILADWKRKEANEPNLPKNWQNIALRGFWLSKDQPEIAEYVRYYQNTIKQLVEASKFERCSFPITADFFIMGEQIKRTTAMRQWARLLVAAGNNDIAEGNTSDAIEKYLVAIRMGHNASQQPSAIEFLVGIACEALAMGSINNFVVCGDANEFYLGKLDRAVSGIRHDWNYDLTGFIDSDKLFFKNLWGIMCYQVNREGKIRFSHNPSEAIREQNKKALGNEIAGTNDIFSGFWCKKLMKALAIPYWFYVPAKPEKLGEIIDAGYEDHYLMTKPDFNWPKKYEMPPEYHFKINIHQLIELMAKTNKSTYPGLHNIYLRTAAQQRGTLLLIALRRYKNANGNWPEKLEDINNLVPVEIFVDSMNNSSFVYMRNADEFTLYSKGQNGIDDDGKREEYECPDTNNVLNKGCDDFIIWPTKSKISQQQEQKTEN